LMFIFCVLCCVVCPFFFFFSSRRRHTRSKRDWSSDVCSSDLNYNVISVETVSSQTSHYCFASFHNFVLGYLDLAQFSRCQQWCYKVVFEKLYDAVPLFSVQDPECVVHIIKPAPFR